VGPVNWYFDTSVVVSAAVTHHPHNAPALGVLYLACCPLAATWWISPCALPPCPAPRSSLTMMALSARGCDHPIEQAKGKKV